MPRLWGTLQFYCAQPTCVADGSEVLGKGVKIRGLGSQRVVRFAACVVVERRRTGILIGDLTQRCATATFLRIQRRLGGSCDPGQFVRLIAHGLSLANSFR